MKKNTGILSASIIISLAIVASVFIYNSFETKRQAKQTEAGHTLKQLSVNEKILKATPSVVEIDGATLLLIPDISFKNDHLNVTYNFYTYTNGVLVKAPLQN